MTLGDFIKEYVKDHTMTEFIKDSGLSKAYVYMLVNNKNNNGEPIVPSIDTIKKVAKGIHKSFDELLFALDPDLVVSTGRSNVEQPALPPYDSISPITKQIFPLLGNVACGEPIFADQQVECYVQADHPIQADYVLHAKGDSMTGARIYDGDLVFVRQQSSVENGEIAVVLIGDDVTLKRVYFYPEQQLLLLQPENPAYKTIQIMGEDLERVKIIGKAVLAQIALK